MIDAQQKLMDHIESLQLDVATLCVDASMCGSKTQARKAIKGGAVRLGDVKVLDPFAKVFIDEGVWCLAENWKDIDTLSVKILEVIVPLEVTKDV